MGIIYIEGTVNGPTGKSANVRFLVDSGSQYTVLPHEVWQSIELTPQETQTFSLADGTLIERRMSECYIVLPQGQRHTPVVLGEPGDQALLGLVTLEILALVLNPFNRTLQPMRLLMANLLHDRA